ncbi:putative bifunctional diguanylate cyclase/phosphodiesterase [Bacillus seohaeanensis]|uniref:Bifunctional diguanylate cyclase/phosphodiesterase n=1 Tax=Bacillus seohaeanensis TaxID=284580 RepID=A0ABW5RMU7_9BACI
MQVDMKTIIVFSIFLIVILFSVYFYFYLKFNQKYKRMDEELRESKEQFRSVIGSANDAIILADSNAKILSWNNGAKSIFGHYEKEVLGKNLHIIIPEQYREAHDRGIKRFLTTNTSKVIGSTVELLGLKKDGTEIPIELSLSTWTVNGEIFFSGIIRDITERKQSEEKINHQAYHDELTNLPNRRRFNQIMEKEVTQAKTNGEKLVVMLLDLDRFKTINDTLGHSIGDLLLKKIAERLHNCIEKKDLVARMGGDEFTLLMPRVRHIHEASTMAEKIMKVLEEPVIIDKHEIFVSTSIGIVQYPTDGQEVETLMKKADIAMYRAKEKGKSTYKFYHSSVDAQETDKIELEKDLRNAIEEDQFAIYYQPKIDIETREIIGMEALVRWIHPTKGLISPGCFIPLTEETGLIIPLGEKILRMVCQQLKTWEASGLQLYKVAVNVSTRQFHNENFVESVATILEETKLNPSYLELEVTESTTMNNVNRAEYILNQLVDLGVSIAIDDFGIEYSSLNYLKKYPIHTLKIDQSFIRGLTTDSHNPAIVSAIISLAKHMNLNIVAEGVEDEQQFGFLKEQKCNQAQGYLFNKPLPAKEFEELLKKKKVVVHPH